MTEGLVVGLKKISPAAQEKMKMTREKIAYDQGVVESARFDVKTFNSSFFFKFKLYIKICKVFFQESGCIISIVQPGH
jgi:hypothetical protein